MIYFVRGQRSGMVKIGYTARLKGRLGALQTGSPESLELVGFIDGDRTTERELHERFKDARAHGEWFHPRKELSDFLGTIRSAPRFPDAHERQDQKREASDLIQLAADKHGTTPAQWYRTYAMAAVIEIASEQLAREGTTKHPAQLRREKRMHRGSKPDPSDELSTLTSPASAEVRPPTDSDGHSSFSLLSP